MNEDRPTENDACRHGVPLFDYCRTCEQDMPADDHDAGLCREFIVTGRCGHSDAEHDAISDASLAPPNERR